MSWTISLPVMAALNIIDTGISYILISVYGIAYEYNPIFTRIFYLDPTGASFVTVKLLLSGLIIVYWMKSKNVPRFISALCFIGVIAYSVMLSHGIITFLMV
jgi:hypothetical protein